MPKPKGVLVIPDKIDGHTVTEIEGDCFRCEEVSRIVLPPHLEKLRGTTWNRVHTPGHKFGGCYNLESIEISPANQSFTSVNGALYTKDKKRLIVYPKTRSSISLARECNVVGESAFSDCKKFKTVKLPDSVAGIMTAAFLGCENLETAEFPKGVNDFGVYVFPCCPNLRKVVFHGDAPGHWVRRMASGALDTLLSHSNCDIVIEVEKGSTGWAGKNSTTLPARWPLDGNTYDSRPIRYIGEMSPYRKPGVATGWKVEVAIGYFTGNVPNEQFLDSGNNASDNYPVLAFSTGGTERASEIGAERVSFPGNPGTVRFTSRSKGTMRVPAAGDWTFAVQSDDGYRVEISGNGYFTVFSGGVTGAKCHTVTLPTAGDYEVEILHSNIGGPACLDFSAAKGRFTDFRPSEFKLVGDPTGQIKMANSER